MSPGPAPAPSTVSPAQQAVLAALRRRSACPQALALWVRIILGAAAGQRNEPLARQLNQSSGEIHIDPSVVPVVLIGALV